MVCGFATDERKRIEVAENLDKCSRYPRVVGERGRRAEMGHKVGEYAWIGEGESGRNRTPRTGDRG